MPLIPGTIIEMDGSGVVTGTASSMALARGQAWATHLLGPAFVAIDEAIAEATDPATIAALQEAKQKLADTFNESTAAFIVADSQAICAHVATNLRLTIGASHAGLQRSTAEGDPTDGPSAPVPINGAFS
jgi:hypothetical protein